MINAITPKELKERQDRGDPILLLDVREPWEYATAKIDRALLIPLGTLPQSLGQLNRATEIVVVGSLILCHC